MLQKPENTATLLNIMTELGSLIFFFILNFTLELRFGQYLQNPDQEKKLRFKQSRNSTEERKKMI